MNLGHPVLQDMIRLGCKKQNKIFLAFQSYIELCEVHKAEAVSYHLCAELDLIYLTASLCGDLEVYVPLSVSSSITPSWIRKFRSILPKEFQDKGIYIILCDNDTTNVMYKISDGLERPLSPESTKHKKEQKERKNFIEIELSNLLPTLIKEAKRQKLSCEESEIK
ncbi:uncharacterized protein [Halyomorpha halys]|uniref:uncharacterized protein n=1 Tax=Halyomorpha halys TaxID=286706 RepID=UPI0006D4F043|nr:uncharacterized protein LOC106689670 [Halyomorpha halys]